MPVLTPQDLPQEPKATFIAYGPEQRCANPEPNNGLGDVLSIRPQTYVTYYQGIGIGEIKHGGRGDIDVVRVEFVPDSVGLREPIAANLDPDDPLVEYLENAKRSDRTVHIGIETIRKVKTKGSRTPISPLTPIHALRGAEDRSGTRAKSEATGDTCRKMLVMVDGRPGKALVSDPTEWAALVQNKGGDLPPEGYQFLGSTDDWTKIGTIIPDGTAPRGAVDPRAIAEALLPLLAPAVAKAMHESDADSSSRAPGRAVGKFSEGLVYEPRTSDGRINLGNYIATNYGYLYRWVHTYLTTSEAPTEPEVVAKATQRIALVIDMTQERAYGHGFLADRNSASWTEASRWVQHVIQTSLAYTAQADAQWADRVATVAASLHRQAGTWAGQHLTDRANTQKANRESAPQEQAPEQTGPSPQVVNALLGTLNKGWDDHEVIIKIGAQVIERGWVGLEVSLDPESNTLSYPPADGHPLVTLGPFLHTRRDEINAAQVATASQQQQSRPEPQQEQAPLALPPNAVAFISHVRGAANIDSIRRLTSTARSTNAMNLPIPVQQAPDGSLTYDETGTKPGFERWTVSQVLQHLASRTPDAPETASTPAAAQGHSARQEAQGTETPEQAAQRIADAAADAANRLEAKTVTPQEASARLADLRQQAVTADVLEVMVSIGAREGALRRWLDNRQGFADRFVAA